jgi:3'-phosphoadenosine 5'-phosphosulfate (PAPS) 3'-phosphatase
MVLGHLGPMLLLVIHVYILLNLYKLECKERVAVTTRSHYTDSIKSSIDMLVEKNLVSRVERVGGAGFKVLKCLEGAVAYIFPSGGCKKWDTAAPEAVLTAAGTFCPTILFL